MFSPFANPSAYMLSDPYLMYALMSMNPQYQDAMAQLKMMQLQPQYNHSLEIKINKGSKKHSSSYKIAKSSNYNSSHRTYNYSYNTQNNTLTKSKQDTTNKNSAKDTNNNNNNNNNNKTTNTESPMPKAYSEGFERARELLNTEISTASNASTITNNGRANLDNNESTKHQRSQSVNNSNNKEATANIFKNVLQYLLNPVEAHGKFLNKHITNKATSDFNPNLKDKEIATNVTTKTIPTSQKENNKNISQIISQTELEKHLLNGLSKVMKGQESGENYMAKLNRIEKEKVLSFLAEQAVKGKDSINSPLRKPLKDMTAFEVEALLTLNNIVDGDPNDSQEVIPNTSAEGVFLTECTACKYVRTIPFKTITPKEVNSVISKAVKVRNDRSGEYPAWVPNNDHAKKVYDTTYAMLKQIYKDEGLEKLFTDDIMRRPFDFYWNNQGKIQNKCNIKVTNHRGKKVANKQKSILENGVQKDIMVIRDLRLNSSRKRSFAIDMNTGKVIRKMLTGHGKGSDKNHDGMIDNRKNSFANVSGKLTSLSGILLTTGKTTLTKKSGRSIPAIYLQGLDYYNNGAFRDSKKIHPAEYVGVPGPQGRSHGCPAFSSSDYQFIKQNLAQNAIVYNYTNIEMSAPLHTKASGGKQCKL